MGASSILRKRLAAHHLSACHHLCSLQILLTRANSLSKPRKFSLQISNSLLQLVILKCQANHLLLRLALALESLFLVGLVNLHARLELCGATLEAHVVLVQLVGLLNVLPALSLQFSDQTFDLALILADLGFQSPLLCSGILYLGAVPLN